MDKPKPFAIPQWLVYQAYERVKANRGTAGVDGESLRMFEEVVTACDKSTMMSKNMV